MKPSYKEGWEIPGGYVEPGESPRSACNREIREEIALPTSVGALLVVDWAPLDLEGDKILFIFDAGVLDNQSRAAIRFSDGELTEWRFAHAVELDGFMPARLVRRIRTALAAKSRGIATYAEHGAEPSSFTS